MRILHIASGDFFSSYGGGQVYVKRIVDEMIDQGRDVGIVSFVGGISSFDKKEYRSVPLYLVPTDYDAEMGIRHAIYYFRPNIVHAHSMKAAAVRAGHEMDVPVVVTTHHGGIFCPAGTAMDANEHKCTWKMSHRNCLPCVLRNIRGGKYAYPLLRLLPRGLYLWIGRMLEKAPFIPFITPYGQAALSIDRKIAEWQEIAEGCSLMIAPCRLVAEMEERNGLDAQKVVVVPHGIPLPFEVPRFPAVVGRKVKFFYVGRICDIKAIHVLIKAFEGVNAPEAELHLIGGAGRKSEERYMRRLMRSRDGRIIWHGKIAAEAVAEAIEEFHISVSVPIYLEVFGLNIAESLSMGKPVLATRCGGAEMQIEEGRNGWLVAPNDVDALRRKMQDLADNFVSVDPEEVARGVISIAEHCEELMGVYGKVWGS